MLIITIPTTLLQIFCKIFGNSKVIVKTIIDPDSKPEDVLSINGLWIVYISTKMIIKTQHTSPLQISCRSMFYWATLMDGDQICMFVKNL